MRNLTKGVLVLAVMALVVGQWQFDIGQKAIAYFQGKSSGDTATAPAAAGPGAKRGTFPTLVKMATAALGDMPLIERAFGTSQSPQIAIINARIASQVVNVPVTDGALTMV